MSLVLLFLRSSFSEEELIFVVIVSLFSLVELLLRNSECSVSDISMFVLGIDVGRP